MPISSFYGLQTSLRGLLAQQRALDTTGHNIANASTQGYSRQEAVMAAAPALAIPGGAVQGGNGAHIGSGVDIQTYRRVRDAFLDLQYRAQAAELRDDAPDQKYRSFIARVGSEVRDARRKEANAESLTGAVEDRRESVAGVSLDKEMGKIVRFQRAYQASSRAMSTMDEMLDVLINRTGRVGL